MLFHLVDSKSPYSLELYNFFSRYKESFNTDMTFVSYSRNVIEEKGIQIVYITSFLDFLKLFANFKKEDRVIFHSFFHPYLYLLSVTFFWKLHLITWVIWGGDLFLYAKRTERLPIKYRIYDVFRKFSIRRFRYVAVEGDKVDYLLAKSYYNITKDSFIKLLYPLDWSAKQFFSVRENPKPFKVLLGNSADPSNNHIELLTLLSKHESEDIVLYLPLSYGGNLEYVNSVISLGKQLFGEKFVPLVKMMDKKSYIEFLSDIDCVIFGHDRQQGLGNIRLLIMMGKKIFIKSNNSSNDYLKELGIQYYFTEDIANLSFDQLKCYSTQQAENNITMLEKEYRDENVLKNWQNFISYR